MSLTSKGEWIKLYAYLDYERPDETLESVDLIGQWNQYQDQLHTVARQVKLELAIARNAINALEGKRDEIIGNQTGDLEETMKAMIDPSGWRLE